MTPSGCLPGPRAGPVPAGLTVVLCLPDGVSRAPEAGEHEEHGQLVGVRPPQQEGDDAGQVGDRTCGQRGEPRRGEGSPLRARRGSCPGSRHARWDRASSGCRRPTSAAGLGQPAAGVGAPHRLSTARLPSGLARHQGRKWAEDSEENLVLWTRSPNTRGADPVREGGCFIRATGGVSPPWEPVFPTGRGSRGGREPPAQPPDHPKGCRPCVSRMK